MKDKYLSEIAVLIPSYDPDEQMVEYVRALKKKGFERIIVVDDGSRENTRCYFEEISDLEGVVILRHAVNQGKGRALKTGMHFFLNTYSSKDMVGLVTADADGQHSPRDTVAVARCLWENGDFVLGTRNFKQENVPFKSRSGNCITTTIFTLLYGKKIHDTQTGLRGISYELVEECLKLQGERFEYEIEMLIAFVRNKVGVTEVPIETIYVDSNRATHFHALKDSIRIYRVILRSFLLFSMSGLLSFVIDISLFTLLSKVLIPVLDIRLGVLGATLFARVCSSVFNYSVNRSRVFRRRKGALQSLVRYYILCLCQLLLSWLLVVAVYDRAQFDITIIKCIVDVILFFGSYQIQRLWVFPVKAGTEKVKKRY